MTKEKKNKKTKKTCTSIGGQAVLEGVMMRGESVIATAVRDPSGNIQLESERFEPLKDKSVAYRIPIIRGIISFFTSMIMGMKIITRSAEVFTDDIIEEEPGKFEKWMAKTFKVDSMQIATAIGVVLGVIIAIALFIFLPTYLTKLIYNPKAVDLSHLSKYLQSFIPNITSGVFKLTIFLGYIISISFMKDIKRLFRYHGAEHKTISAYEHGLELTVENVQKMKTAHDRCGTTFIVIVLTLSILVLSFLPWFGNVLYNFLIRLAFLPIIMGLSYELLKLFARFDNIITKILKAPGLLLQKLTVKQPDDSMVEVAIMAFNTVLAMQADETVKPTTFNIYTSKAKAKSKLVDIIKYDNLQKSLSKEEKENKIKAIEDEVDLIIMSVLNLDKKSDLVSVKRLSAEEMDKAKAIAEKRQKGIPLQYAIGFTNFYGLDFKVDARALIPRFDTEILVEKTIELIKEKQSDKFNEAEVETKEIETCDVLDLCTGTGAIGICIKKFTNANVVASDISFDALSLAKENAEKHGVEIDFIQSDLFEKITGKFDYITVNPPYIKKSDLSTLDAEVKNHEPKLALDGGEDGLDFYKKISASYQDFLKPNGALILEIGIGQKEDVASLFNGEISIYSDYNTPPVPRVVVVKNELKQD